MLQLLALTLLVGMYDAQCVTCTLSSSTFHLMADMSGPDLQPFGLMQSQLDGLFYEMAYGGSLFHVGAQARDVLTSPPVPAPQSYSVIHSFDITGPDCSNPSGELIQDENGVLYGLTRAVSVPSPMPALSCVFSIHSDGSAFTVLHRFAGGETITVSADASGNRLLLLNGMLYGVITNYAVTFDGLSSGFIYRMNTDGSGYTVFHDFPSVQSIPNTPMGILSVGAANETQLIFGTLFIGGPGCGAPSGNTCGGVYQITTAGVFTLLYQFTSYLDGLFPEYGVMVSSDGNTLYGFTYGTGTVFSLSRDPSTGLHTMFKLIHSFRTIASLSNPPILDTSQRWLYGALHTGSSGGSVYRLAVDGSSYTVLQEFDNNKFYAPVARLLQSKVDGNLYGSLSQGNANGCVGQPATSIACQNSALFSLSINQCDAYGQPCRNGGNCTSAGASYTCDCAGLDYHGDNCEVSGAAEVI